MRSRPLTAILLALAFSAAACQFIWSYDNLKDQPDTGGDAGSDAGSDAESDAGSESDGAANGLACEAGTDCQSGYCEPVGDDGGTTVCCVASCGACETCDADGGAACVLVPKGAPGPGCTGSVACDGAGVCKVQNGGVCPNGGDAVCLSGICSTGVCCTMACPACQVCKGDGSGCANKPAFSTDSRCKTMFNVCNGNGGCA